MITVALPLFHSHLLFLDSSSTSRASPAIVQIYDITLSACSRLSALYYFNPLTTATGACSKVGLPLCNTIPDHCPSSNYYRCQVLPNHRVSFGSVLTITHAPWACSH
eukprot:IDg11447t1